MKFLNSIPTEVTHNKFSLSVVGSHGLKAPGKCQSSQKHCTLLIQLQTGNDIITL